MCELAVESSGWIVVDPWETITPEYVPTANVLDHFEHEINEVLGGVERPDGTRVPAKICLLAGADLISTMVRISDFKTMMKFQRTFPEFARGEISWLLNHH
jgi:nicotinic acid mononucleotide adenylyltransferase